MPNFISTNFRFLTFSTLLTFFSGFGQTFLLALYVPVISQEFSITTGKFGSLYALVTILSAFCITFIGKLIDKVPIRKYAISVILGLTASLFLVGEATHISLLLLGIWGLRLFGQGLMGHTSTTAVLRAFDKDRGKALSITTLGYPLSQAVLPILITVLLSHMDWRESITVSAIFTASILLPFMFICFKDKHNATYNNKEPQITTSKEEWRQIDILRNKKFYMLCPGILIIPFLITGLFFYQVNLAEAKGWDLKWLAICYTGYAIANGTAILISGTLIDRYSVRRIYRIFLIPLLFAIGVLLISDAKWSCMAYMILAGISVGFGATLRAAIQAEVYGTKTIGAVRSLFATCMIIFTALGPLVFGLLIDYNFSFASILALSFVLIALSILINNLIHKNLNKEERIPSANPIAGGIK